MNELTERFRGVFTALVTPFRDGAVDYAAYDALVERQIDAGIAGLVPVGTTGEAATLSDEEADALIARTVRLAAGRALVMAGAGANDTLKTVDKVRRAEKAGADAVLIVTPYYNKPMQAGLIAHYGAAAEATSLPVMLYSVPGRCGVEIAPDVMVELLEALGFVVSAGHELLGQPAFACVVPGYRPDVEREIDEDAPEGPVVRKHLVARDAGSGQLVAEFDERVRLYMPAEVDALLVEADLELVGDRMGHVDGRPLTDDAPRYVRIARRPR